MLGAIKSTFTSKGLDKPQYQPVSGKFEGFEVRRYAECKWVSTTAKSMRYKDASSKSFWKLFNYIRGENEEKKKVEMTAPVSTKVIPGEGPNCENSFTMSFYVPPEHQADPPKPSNPDVFLTDFPEMTVAVKSFGGFASESDWIEKGRELGEAAEKAGLADKLVQDYYFTAGYDSPFKLFGRVNEVWMVLRDDPFSEQQCVVLN